MRWRLDSVILLDHFNGVDSATRFIAEEGADAALSPVTRAEVLTGFSDDRRPVASELLDQFPTLPISIAEADLAAPATGRAGLCRAHRWGRCRFRGSRDSQSDEVKRRACCS